MLKALEMSFTEINHYVPQWYQKRFLPVGLKEQKFYYLDLKPEKVAKANGGYYYRDALRRLGTANCFCQNHLYTLFFQEDASDIIEKRFFGAIDQFGVGAVDFFSKYEVSGEAIDAYQNLLRYLDAQKLRTPKGLDFIRVISRRRAHQDALNIMGALWQIHCTIWTEGVWEVLECDHSETKFIISDHPVTTYNKDLFPGSKFCLYPFDAPIELVGTHTIFPLDLNRCLVITNLGYVRDPWMNRLKKRENPRYYQQAVFDIRKVQTGRQIPENEVRAINYILKNRAKRFIAAVNKEWLYPENFLRTTNWDKLADKYFLMPDPRKVSFTTEVLFGGDGWAWGTDEYGRRPKDDNPEVNTLRDKEWDSFHRAKQSWDDHFGKLSLSKDEMMRYL